VDDRDEVLFAPVDDDVGTRIKGDLPLGLAAPDSDDGRACCLAELYSRSADTARRRLHEQGFARLELAAAVQAEPARLVSDDEGGCLSVAQSLWRWEGRGRRHDDGFGHDSDVRRDDAVAD